MPPRLHPAEQYARDVINRKIPACHWVEQACARYFDDKKHAKERGLVFSKDRAQLVIDFFGELQLSQGEFAGRPFVLEGWELFIVWNLFGWYRAKHPRWVAENFKGQIEDTSGTRRFRTSFVSISRKNGKTALAAGIGLYLAFADQEYGAEVYSAATKKDQAKICHDEATRMVEMSEWLREEGGVATWRNNISQEHTYSKFEPLSADEKTLDGLRVHGGILDEVHAWKNSGVYVKLNRATSARRNPLIFMITTAGKTEESKFCWDQQEYTSKILDGIIEDDTWFGIIYSIDEGDDWRDETNWIKANPGLGVNKKFDYMRTEAARAAEMPTALNDFLQYDLNVWVRSEAKWMPMDHWRLCSGPVPALQLEDALIGRPCCVGMDLSSVSDLTSLLLSFPPTEADPLEYVLPFFFCPEDGIFKRSRNDRVPYDVWADQGYIIPTPGNITDQAFIMAKLGQLMQKFQIKRLMFDRWGSTKIITDLQSDLGFTVDMTTHERNGVPLLVQFGQGFVSMSPPMNDLLRVVLLHQLAHGDHPILTWNMDNLIARSDPAGNIKPDKEKSRERIDGGVTLIMAHAGVMVHNPQEFRSVYEDRGIITV
jgi:phage terminase large subunit-like protein